MARVGEVSHRDNSTCTSKTYEEAAGLCMCTRKFVRFGGTCMMILRRNFR